MKQTTQFAPQYVTFPNNLIVTSIIFSLGGFYANMDRSNNTYDLKMTSFVVGYKA